MRAFSLYLYFSSWITFFHCCNSNVSEYNKDAKIKETSTSTSFFFFLHKFKKYFWEIELLEQRLQSLFSFFAKVSKIFSRDRIIRTARTVCITNSMIDIYNGWYESNGRMQRNFIGFDVNGGGLAEQERKERWKNLINSRRKGEGNFVALPRNRKESLRGMARHRRHFPKHTRSEKRMAGSAPPLKSTG